MKHDAPVMLMVTKHALNVFGVLTVLTGVIAVATGPSLHTLLPLLAGLWMLFAGALLHLATALTQAAEEYLRCKTAALQRDAAND
ncbi:MAG: hypothetical protein GXY15_08635 [Candidatus Hydrogenedentes bacterium]|nr:hypothetical protein [Candidatus Hydrogenedentota bacterium]